MNVRPVMDADVDAIAALAAEDEAAIFGRPSRIGVAAQGAKGRGLGSQIVETCDARVRESGASRIQTFALEPDASAAALFEGFGVGYVRRFFEMAVELESPPSEPVLGGGLTLERFQREDARPFSATLDAGMTTESSTLAYDKALP